MKRSAERKILKLLHQISALVEETHLSAGDTKDLEMMILACIDLVEESE